MADQLTHQLTPQTSLCVKGVNSFIPRIWAEEVQEYRKSPQKQAFVHYLIRYINGLPVPDWMLPKLKGSK